MTVKKGKKTKKKTKSKSKVKQLAVIDNPATAELVKHVAEDFPPEPKAEPVSKPLPPSKPVAPTASLPKTNTVKKKRKNNSFQTINKPKHKFY